MRGSLSCALTFTDLGSEKHVTSAEVEDAVKVCDKIMEDTNTFVGSIAVDNAECCQGGRKEGVFAL